MLDRHKFPSFPLSICACIYVYLITYVFVCIMYVMCFLCVNPSTLRMYVCGSHTRVRVFIRVCTIFDKSTPLEWRNEKLVHNFDWENEEFC